MDIEIRHSVEGLLELRHDGRMLRGRFPYGKTAVIADRGKVRKETFSIGAFRYSIQEAKAKRARIDLLEGHSFDRSLANSIDETVEFSEIRNERGGMDLVFEAVLPVEARQPSYKKDMLLKVRAGLAKGISPGFRVPPPLSRSQR